MTAPDAVDVLEVLALAAERERAAGMPDGVQMAARDAVDELLLIGREVEQADRDGATTDELMDRFRAALARVGGAR